jgi:hypothetical protein
VLGYLAYRLNKEWLWAIASLGVVLIGFSRLYLGVQFPVGVLSGWVLGLGVVFLLLKAESLSLCWWANLSTGWQVGIAFGISMVMILAGDGIRELISSSPDPVSWAEFATQGRSLTQYFAFSGGLFGAASGYILMKKHLDFQTKGALTIKVGRCLLGFAGLGLIYFSLGWVVNSLFIPETLPAYVLRYIQVALMTFWVLFGAPWCFVKVKLAESQII